MLLVIFAVVSGYGATFGDSFRGANVSSFVLIIEDGETGGCVADFAASSGVADSSPLGTTHIWDVVNLRLCRCRLLPSRV